MWNIPHKIEDLVEIQRKWLIRGIKLSAGNARRGEGRARALSKWKRVKERWNGPSVLAEQCSVEGRAKRINDLPSRDFLSSGLRDMRCTLRAMRYLRRRVIVSVSVPGNLTFTPHVMVRDSFPPDGRLRRLQLRDLRQHAVLALRV